MKRRWAICSKENSTLVLSRTIGQEIVVDDAVRIRIVDVRGCKVRIGIMAPDNVDVDRIEVRQRKLEESFLKHRQAEPVLS